MVYLLRKGGYLVREDRLLSRQGSLHAYEHGLPIRGGWFTYPGKAAYLFGEGCVLQLDVGLGVSEDRFE